MARTIHTDKNKYRTSVRVAAATVNVQLPGLEDARGAGRPFAKHARHKVPHAIVPANGKRHGQW
eukprot:scaffold17113_cov130-Isochrysis_galbana.AAC.2